MKKLLLGILAVITVVSLTACNFNKNTNISGDGNNVIENDETYTSGETQDINTVNVPELVLDKDLDNATLLEDENGKYVKFSDGYQLSNGPHLDCNYLGNIDNLKNNKREILPSKIYLVDAGQECLYEYNGTKYNVPIEKCDSLADERVEYKDYNIQYFFNADTVKINGIEIRAGEHYSFEDVSEVSMFDGQILKLYEMDFDNNLKTKEIVFDYILDNPDGRAIYAVKVASINDNGEVRESGTMNNFYTNVESYRNVFYNAHFADTNINEYIEEYFMCKYYIYDENDGIISVYRYANGDVYGSDLSKTTFTLRKDVKFKEYKFGEYEGKKVNYTTDMVNQNDESEEGIITLSKGTKIHIIEVINSDFGDTIIETEDGTRYLFATSAARVM